MSRIVSFALLVSFIPARIFAQSTGDILRTYEDLVRRENPRFSGFSAERGRELYTRNVRSENGSISCSTCHTSDPKGRGRTRANKDIEPLAPSANPLRFKDYRKTEKWFTRNCDDVLSRECSAMEKGDFITYLIRVK